MTWRRRIDRTARLSTEPDCRQNLRRASPLAGLAAHCGFCAAVGEAPKRIYSESYPGLRTECARLILNRSTPTCLRSSRLEGRRQQRNLRRSGVRNPESSSSNKLGLGPQGFRRLVGSIFQLNPRGLHQVCTRRPPSCSVERCQPQKKKACPKTGLPECYATARRLSGCRRRAQRSSSRPHR